MSIALPSFMEKTAEGLMVQAVPLRQLLATRADGFIQAVDALLAQGQRFYGLDYAVFSQLVLNPETIWRRGGSSRLAADVVSFPEYRQELYKGVRFSEDNMQVEYIFQPVVVDTPYQHPLYGDRQPDGTVPVVGHEKRVRQEDAVLDLDEFVAAMWSKGVRCGLLLDAITPALFTKKINRMVVAQGQPAQVGKTAEVWDMLTPARQMGGPLWRQGKWDLRNFENKFPPVEQGQTIIKKVACRAGKPGFTVRGDVLPAPPAQDIDLSVLVGEGVALEDAGDSELLVARKSGFLGVERESQSLFVTRTIETRVDINVKNTGDMALAADAFIAHGEVQEGRTVQGKHMRFAAPVYGHVQSDQGTIALDDVLSGGSAVLSGEGQIHIPQRAIHARVVAVEGKIDVQYAENCLIVGDDVTVQQAVHCTIVANQVRIQSAQACTIVGNGVKIDRCDEHKGEPCRVWVVQPSLKTVQSQLQAAQLALKLAQSSVTTTLAELASIKNNAEFARYIALRDAMQGDPATLSAASKEEFAALHLTQSLHLKTIERLLKSLEKARAEVPERTAQRDQAKTHLDDLVQRHFCAVTEVSGETRIFTLNKLIQLSAHVEHSAKELAQWLASKDVVAQSAVLFQGQSGSVDWRLSTD